MDYTDRMDLTSEEIYNKKLLCAICLAAQSMVASEDIASWTFAGKVARNPKLYSPAFATMVASLGSVTSDSTDQEFYDAVASLWPLMSLEDA